MMNDTSERHPKMSEVSSSPVTYRTDLGGTPQTLHRSTDAKCFRWNVHSLVSLHQEQMPPAWSGHTLVPLHAHMNGFPSGKRGRVTPEGPRALRQEWAQEDGEEGTVLKISWQGSPATPLPLIAQGTQ